MRRLKMQCGTLLCVSFIFAGISYAGGTILQNPGFENLGWPPACWDEWQGSSSCSPVDGVVGYISNTIAHSGSQSAVKKLYGGNYRWGGYSRDVAVNEGNLIDASGWLMSSSSSGPLANGAKAYIEVKFFDGTNNKLATFQSSPLTNASPWIQHFIKQKAPAGSRNARFSFVLLAATNNASGTVYFDDAAIEVDTVFSSLVTDITDSSAVINFHTSLPEKASVEYRGSCAALLDPSLYPLPSLDYVRGIIYDPNDSPYPDTYVSDFPEIRKYFNTISVYGQEFFGHGIFDALAQNGLSLVFRIENFNKCTGPDTVIVDTFDSYSRYANEAKNDIGYWVGAGDLGSGGYHTVTSEGALKIHWTAGTGWWTTVLKDNSPYFDVTDYYGLSFNIKSDNNGELIYIGLEDGNGQKGILPISRYLPSGVLTDYSYVEIPLREFSYANPNLDMSRIKNLVFLFCGNNDGVIYADNIFINGKMVFDYTYQDADWVIEHYREPLTYILENYPGLIAYYVINMPLDNEKLNLPSLEKQGEYVSYLAGRVKNEFDSTKPIYVNYYNGYKDELIQCPARYMTSVDGATLVVYPMHFDESVYGDGIPQAGPKYVPRYEDPAWLQLMKDQIDYYIDKTVSEDGNRPILIDQIGYANVFYRPWRFDVNGRVADNRAKYTSIIYTRDYIESLYPDVMGWFYFLYYNNNWEANWGLVDQETVQEESAANDHAVKLSNLFPNTEYTYTIRTNEGGRQITHTGNFATHELVPPETDPLSLITVTNPPYGNTWIDAERRIEIRWKDSDSRPDATISLYWDTNDRDFMLDKPWYISANNFIVSFNESDTANRYVWNTAGMPPGSYYIYAVLNNGGANQEVIDYSSGQAVLSNVNISAYKTDSQIVVDGYPDDQAWQTIGWNKFAVHPAANVYSSAGIKVLWDFDSLYLFFKVDDTQLETSRNAPWDGDSIHFIINNGSSATNSFVEVGGRGGGTLYRGSSLIGASTIDNNNDIDSGYYVEMRIKWLDLTRIVPSTGDIIPIDILSIDHDGNPGASWRNCLFSKIGLDGDGNIETAGRSIILNDTPAGK